MLSDAQTPPFELLLCPNIQTVVSIHLLTIHSDSSFISEDVNMILLRFLFVEIGNDKCLSSAVEDNETIFLFLAAIQAYKPDNIRPSAIYHLDGLQ